MKKGRALPPEARKLAAAVKWPLLGFLLCGGQVAGLYAPFALAAVAVAGIRLAGLGAVLGVAGGAFVFMDFQSGLRCAAAAILIFAANTALYDTAVYKKPYFRALICWDAAPQAGFWPCAPGRQRQGPRGCGSGSWRTGDFCAAWLWRCCRYRPTAFPWGGWR